MTKPTLVVAMAEQEVLEARARAGDITQGAAKDLLAACKGAFGVLTEPGIMDVDEWKAWQHRVTQELHTAIAKAEPKR